MVDGRMDGHYLDSVMKILFSIRNNARKSLTVIAKELGVDRRTVASIVKKMEDDNIVWGYNPIIDVTKLGYKYFTVLVRMKATINYDRLGKVLLDSMVDGFQKLNQSFYIVDSGYTHGVYDFYVRMVARRVVDVKKFMNQLIQDNDDFVDGFDILEEIITIRRCNLVNPELERLVHNIIDSK